MKIDFILSTLFRYTVIGLAVITAALLLGKAVTA